MTWSSLKIINHSRGWETEILPDEAHSGLWNIESIQINRGLASDTLPLVFDPTEAQIRFRATSEINLPMMARGDIFEVILKTPTGSEWVNMGGWLIDENTSISSPDNNSMPITHDITVTGALSAFDKEFTLTPGAQWTAAGPEAPGGLGYIEARRADIEAEAGVPVNYPGIGEGLDAPAWVTATEPLDPIGANLRDLLNNLAQTSHVLKIYDPDLAQDVYWAIPPSVYYDEIIDGLPQVSEYDVSSWTDADKYLNIAASRVIMPVTYRQLEATPTSVNYVTSTSTGEENIEVIQIAGTTTSSKSISTSTWNTTRDPYFNLVRAQYEDYAKTLTIGGDARIPSSLELKLEKFSNAELAALALKLWPLKTLRITGLADVFSYPTIHYPIKTAQFTLAAGELSIVLEPYRAQFIQANLGPMFTTSAFTNRTLSSFNRERFSDLTLV